MTSKSVLHALYGVKKCHVHALRAFLGLTDDNKPRRLGPKRAANIRKTFNLQKEDNVCSYVVRREAGKKKKAPKVQQGVIGARVHTII